jgi:hypothetical protein
MTPMKTASVWKKLTLPVRTAGSPDKIAFFVSLTAGTDQTAFDRLLTTSGHEFTRAAILTATTTNIDAREAGRLSASIAQHIKQLAASRGRAEVHLAFHGPYTMALLIGRYLNTHLEPSPMNGKTQPTMYPGTVQLSFSNPDMPVVPSQKCCLGLIV